MLFLVLLIWLVGVGMGFVLLSILLLGSEGACAGYVWVVYVWMI